MYSDARVYSVSELARTRSQKGVWKGRQREAVKKKHKTGTIAPPHTSTNLLRAYINYILYYYLRRYIL